MSEHIAPWLQKPLDEWAIVGMNHYFVNGQRFLFVAMVKDGRCIKAEGQDDRYLWNKLLHQLLWPMDLTVDGEVREDDIDEVVTYLDAAYQRGLKDAITVIRAHCGSVLEPNSQHASNGIREAVRALTRLAEGG